MKRFHGRNLRKGRRSIVNQIYLVTAVTKDRIPQFHDLYSARLLIRTLMEQDDRMLTQTLAFVVMPDHFHWLFQLTGRVSLSRVVNNVKGKTARRLNVQRKQTGISFWQSGFHDHALRKEQDIKQVARYMVANPLRAGLVDHIGDYPHWDVAWL